MVLGGEALLEEQSLCRWGRVSGYILLSLHKLSVKNGGDQNGGGGRKGWVIGMDVCKYVMYTAQMYENTIMKANTLMKLKNVFVL